MSLARSAALLCAALTISLPATAFAQATRAEEIQEVRAAMARLSARLDKLEAEERQASPAASATAPPSSVAGAPTQPGSPPSQVATSQIPQLLTGDRQLALSADDIAALSTRTVAGAPLDRALQPDGSGFELSATSDTTSVAIKLARSRSNAGDEFGIYSTYGLTASAPLKTSGRFSDVGTLDGFIGGSRLRFQFSRYQRRITEPDLHLAYSALVETTKAACRARLGAAAKECAPDLISSQFIHDYAPELETALLAMARMTPGPNPRVDWSARAYGLELSVGYKKFNFLNAAPARKSEATRVPIGGKVFYSFLPDVRRNAVTGGLEYQRVFKDATAGALCPAAAAGSELLCLTGPIGGPKRDEKLLLSLDYRHKIVIGETSLIPAIGISAMGTYDALNDEFGVDVPIYLVSDGKSGLTGGIRFGYTTSDKEFIAGVFVGTAFSLR